ncbi:MAG: DUF1080 domain-containing protein, partial [Fimbriimonadaceae bacterium]|nr:DUF1080 domain-containing protein [Fimbriimonadaceae bacterium]
PAKVELFADGLGEPLGIAYWKGDVYVTQKGEVTRLRDTDEDGRADEFLTVAYGWGVSPNYHEFTFNLLPFQDRFYISSSVPLRGGHTNYTPQDDRALPAYSTPEGPGRVYKINPATGEFESIATGLRTPNGMNIGVDGRIFMADNQGTWLPASPLYCLEEGATYLHREQPGGESPTDNVAVWFPHGEIGNSPSQMILIPDGAYRGQMLIGDVTYGGLQRVQLEKVDGKYQGAVYRHSQGLEAGVNRLVWGPDNCLYVGMIGSNGNWNHLGHKFGLERLRPTGVVPFEVLELSVRPNGFQVNFTQPLAGGSEETLRKAVVKSFAYVPMMDYGGPKRDEKTLAVSDVTLSNGGRTAFISIDGLAEKRVIHFHFGDLKSLGGDYLWSPEAFYTLQRLPDPLIESPLRQPDRFARPENAITLIGEKGQGELVPIHPDAPRWRVIGDALEVVHDASADIGGSDQVTPFNHGDIRVHLEWLSPAGGNLAIQSNGNSGIKLQSRYEIQIMNAPGIIDLASPGAQFNEAGSIYRQTAPRWNPSFGAGVWQTYDIWFTAARWEGDKKVANARITLYWNGVLVHNDEEILDKTGLSVAEGPDPMPLLLQDHHTEAEGGVQFRNTWLVHDPIAKGILPPTPMEDR